MSKDDCRYVSRDQAAAKLHEALSGSDPCRLMCFVSLVLPLWLLTMYHGAFTVNRPHFNYLELCNSGLFTQWGSLGTAERA